MQEAVLIEFARAIIAGVSVFVIGQVLSDFYLNPVNELRKYIGEAKFVIIFRANIYCNPGNGDVEENKKLYREREVTAIELRRAASKLFTANDSIKAYNIFYWFNILPSQTALVDAATYMIGLLNAVHNGSCKLNVSHKEKCMQAFNSYKWS